jgi:dehydrogenase/reductase SDR family member 1
MVEDGAFTWSNPFWEQPLWRWDAMLAAGGRAHSHACQLVAPSMSARQRGLIVDISFWAAQKRIGNVAYGVSKAVTDKMTADMATELRSHGVTVVSLSTRASCGPKRSWKRHSGWICATPGLLSLSAGRFLPSLAHPDVQRHTGKVLVAAALAKEYGFTDIDGETPRPLTLAEF